MDKEKKSLLSYLLELFRSPWVLIDLFVTWILEKIDKFLGTNLLQLWEKAKHIITLLKNWILNKINEIVTNAKKALENLINKVKASILLSIASIRITLDNIKKSLSRVWDNIKGKVSKLIDKAISGVKEWVNRKFSEMGNLIHNYILNLVDRFYHIVKKEREEFSRLEKQMLNSLITYFEKNIEIYRRKLEEDIRRYGGIR